MRKPYTIRLNPEIVDKFDKQITTTTRAEAIEQLMLQHMEDQQQHSILEEKDKEITTLTETIEQTKKKYTQTAHELESTKKNYADIQQSLQESQKEVNKQISRYEQLEQDKKEKEEKLEQEKTKWSNKYSHQVEVTNKLQKEHNQLQQKMQKYTFFFGSVTNMSFIDRLLGRFPEEIKELQPAPEDEQ